MKVYFDNNNTYVDIEDFNLAHTLDCGQCFRFALESDDSSVWTGVHKNKLLRVSQENDTLTFFDTNESEFQEIWCDFFDFLGDYKYMKEYLFFDETVKKACEYSGGIRILKQDPWETLCSFIISQNNNIPRIKGIIARMCESFGEKIDENGNYAFPKASTIAALEVEDLSPLRAGFRAKYIIDAAKKVSSGEVDFDSIFQNDLSFGEQELRKIVGVGPKVAQCVLLFGFYKLDAFPVDVWIKKVLEEYYPDGFPEKAKPFAGVAQQFLFHYVRSL